MSKNLNFGYSNLKITRLKVGFLSGLKPMPKQPEKILKNFRKNSQNNHFELESRQKRVSINEFFLWLPI